MRLDPVLCTSSPVPGHQEDAITGGDDCDLTILAMPLMIMVMVMMKVIQVVFALTTQRLGFRMKIVTLCLISMQTSPGDPKHLFWRISEKLRNFFIA